jgi:pimeloyl-ACP methyl ester carboxylesterase
MKMESLELITKDGITLRAFYFASERGKEAVPVIIVHEWQGQASPYAGLVKALWDAGCAVIVPEFRGHGGSREYMQGGRKREFDIARMGRADVANIIGADMEAVKKYLREENNAKKLNLNALALVGVREGAVIASQWAVKDLNFPSVGCVEARPRCESDGVGLAREDH